MAIRFAGVGTAAGSAAIAGTVLPTLPADFVTNDIFICVISSVNGVWTFPAGWTKKIDLTYGSSQFVVAWKRAVVGDTTPSLTSSNNASALARVASFRGVISSGDPFGASASQGNASSATVTAPAITPVTLNNYIIFAGGQNGGVNSAGTFSGYAATNPSSFTEAFQSNINSATNPDDQRIFLSYALKADLVSTGNATATSTLTEPNAGGLLALTPAPSVGSTMYNHVSVGDGMSRGEVAN